MPIIKSAKKRAKQNIVHAKRNEVAKRVYKTAVKKTKKAIKAGQAEEVTKLLTQAYSKIDMAAKKNLIHRNNAARQKSRLTKAANSVLLIKK